MPYTASDKRSGTGCLPYQVAHRFGARRMGQRAEGNIGLLSDRIGLERLHRSFDDTAQARQHIGNRLTCRGVADDRNEPERWVTQHQAHELRSGVAGPSNDDRAYGLRGHVLNSILILTCALSTALSKKAAALKAPRLQIDDPKFSALGVLELLAGAGLTWLLALFLTSVAGDVASFLEGRLVGLVDADEGAGDAVPDRLGLRRDAATGDVDLYVELTLLRERGKRLHGDDPEDLAREVILERATVDRNDACSRAQKDPSDGVLPLACAVVSTVDHFRVCH
jgi:hypothetical protein